MLTEILLVVLSVINIIILFAMVFLLFTSLYPYSVPLLMISVALYLFISITFFKRTNTMLNKQKDKLLLLKINKIKIRENDMEVIEFEKKDGKWISKKDESIVLDLQGYLFQKSFIKAWIIRNIRYRVVSNRLQLIKLSAFKLRVSNTKDLKIRFIEGDKHREYLVVKNNVSKNTILTRSITKSKYHTDFLSAYSYRYQRRVKEINEEIYLDEDKLSEK